ncbi:S8 family serine peptidase [Paucibacter sp. O1-1]|nr:S8 family serine peptidase [Paucibacter sp. O1-1]MDA3829586.1 S8 family serine peptidase [Paucibacter sp. O1-1]
MLTRHLPSSLRAIAPRLVPTLIAAAAVAMLSGALAPQRAQQALAAPLARELVVKLHAPQPAPALLRAHGLHQVRPLGSGWWVLESRGGLDAAQLARLTAALRREPEVEAVLGQMREQRAAVPNDTLFASEQWWLGDPATAGSAGLAGFPKAWDISKGSTDPVIAVLDSGLTAHPDLQANTLPGYNFVSKAEYANNGVGRSNSADDTGDALTQAEFNANPTLWDGCIVNPKSSWHGTLVAGQLGAVTNNAAGVAGINWNARILPVRVSGKCGAAVPDMVDGMRWAAGLPVAGVPANPTPAKILVIGFAGQYSCNVNDANADVAAAAKLYSDTITELRSRGVMIVAAAGNLRSAVGRPANCAGVFGVAAVNRQGFKAYYSNFGSEIQLATTGGDADSGKTCDSLLADSGIASTTNKGTTAVQAGGWGYGAVSGSSFAAPQVAGTAALMWAANPALTLAQVEAGLKISARPHAVAAALGACSAANPSRCTCSTSSCGAGLLDAEQALRYAQAPASYTAPTRTPASLSGAALDSCGALQGSKPIPEPTPTPTPTPSPTPTPTPTPAPAPAPAPESGGGGGASSPLWLLALSLSLPALGLARRRREQDGTPKR